MSLARTDLEKLRELLREVQNLVDRVIEEGNADEDRRAHAWSDHKHTRNWIYYGGTKVTGALRRRSLDLTRALAEMRKS